MTGLAEGAKRQGGIQPGIVYDIRVCTNCLGITGQEQDSQSAHGGLAFLFSDTPSYVGYHGTHRVTFTLIPASTIATLFGNQNAWGILLVATVGAVTLVPGIIAYPLAGSLVRQGAGVVPVAAFMTTLMMVGVVTAPLEIHYFGKRFTLIRNGLSFVAALAIALAMGVVLG